LGISHEGVIDIRSSFPVPHKETENFAVDTEFLSTMLQLHQKANPKEVIVGWYATGSDLNENSLLIHDFFCKETKDTKDAHPIIHLTVDASLIGSGMGIKAYSLTSLTLPFSDNKAMGSQFQPIKLDIETVEAEQTAVENLMRSKSEKGESQTSLDTDLGNIETVISKVLEDLELISEYVEKVVKGEIRANPAIGRFLSDAVASLPKFDTQSYEKMFNDSLQDLLMIVYLSNLVRTQLSISEKLQTIV